MPVIQIPSMLRTFTNGQRSVRVVASTVGDALDELESRHPGVARRVMGREGQLTPAVHVFVGDDDDRQLAGLETPLAEDEVVLIVPAMAGGV